MVAHRVEGDHLRRPATGHEHRDGPGRAAGGLSADRLPEVRAVARVLDDLIDNYGGARQATDHLLALGRRRIGHLAGPLPWREAQDRHDGWRDALRDAGVEPGPVVPGTGRRRVARPASRSSLALAPDLDGLFVANDQMALGVLHVAHARGIAIPDAIAVVGFDGLDEAAHFTPTLTTVIQPLRELGELAVREVLSIAGESAGRGTVRSLTLATQLVIRESAPAASRAPASQPRGARSPVEAAESA